MSIKVVVIVVVVIVSNYIEKQGIHILLQMYKAPDGTIYPQFKFFHKVKKDIRN